MFQLTQDELSAFLKQDNRLRSQIATSNRGGLRYLPFVFTENGIAMLSSVLRSETAININIMIMRAFTAMRRVITLNAQVFQRIETIEYHQLEMKKRQEETDTKIEEVFKRLDAGIEQHKQGIFYDGQTYNAYEFVSGLIRQANANIVLIDNYVDETVLTLLSKRAADVKATVYTDRISQQLQLDITQHNSQYDPIDV